ncbi:MAG TPA: methyltransferase domain-containing protein, partial [Sphingomicrobium sp.]|nr:methyltransferase domain-containing protein [Sphingomicrobium sp.]
GYSRGTPIDRYYIETFLEEHSSDIRGRVLEIGNDTYSRRFGGDRISRQDVLHVRAGHPRATIVGDLADPDVLPERAFNCIIVTQTLHLIFDMARAIEQLHRALKPGGVALITVPGISPIDRGEWKASWYWSLTDLALARLLSGPFERGNVSISTHGNLFAATAFLHGAAVEEVDTARLAQFDASYPVTIAARAAA